MRRAGLLAVLLLVALPLAAGKRPDAEQEKINWLLGEVQRSDAVFLRNGAEYDGRKAASHLKTKLFWAGNRVQTAREFVRGVCAHSETSGKPYEVRFKDGSKKSLETWLSERLDTVENR